MQECRFRSWGYMEFGTVCWQDDSGFVVGDQGASFGFEDLAHSTLSVVQRDQSFHLRGALRE